MTDLLAIAEPRTLNVNQAELYSFYTNDTNAFNNIVAIGGQVKYLENEDQSPELSAFC